MPSNLRELARRFIEAAFASSHVQEAGSEHEVLALAEELSNEDRGLFQEITQGTLREWRFLDWAVGQFAKRKPSSRIQVILNLSAYQLLFLDRVPDYAIFSEAKHLTSVIKANEAELKFVHAVLKSIQKEKAALLEKRESTLKKLETGEIPDRDLDWAVLNATGSLLDSLTVSDDLKSESGSAAKKTARKRAVAALAHLKHRPLTVGYFVLEESEGIKFTHLASKVAPRAVAFESETSFRGRLKSGQVRIQAESSQWACELAAKELMAFKGPVRVLEMATGKGGKLLSTLSALTKLCGGDASKVPALEWVAVDSSSFQLEIFEKDTASLVHRNWPQVKLTAHRLAWSGAGHEKEALGEEHFDFVWLDAPCSGLGTLSKLPQIGLRLDDKVYEECMRLSLLQKSLCASGLVFLKKNSGKFFYSVCTMTRPETFDVVRSVETELGRKPVLQTSLWPGSEPAPSSEGFFGVLF